MSKEITLTQEQVAIVDDWRYDELNQFKWYAYWSESTKSFYAARQPSRLLGKRKMILMHAFVAKTPSGMETDHINHKTLDNQEHNLRVCTHSQNTMNSNKYQNNTSGYKGVTPRGKRYRAWIRFNGKLHHLGSHQTAEEAARIYDEAAKKYHGEFASLNFP